MPAKAARITKSIAIRQPVKVPKKAARSTRSGGGASGRKGVANQSSSAMTARPSAPKGGRRTPTSPFARISEATAPSATPTENPTRRTVKTPSSAPSASRA